MCPWSMNAPLSILEHLLTIPASRSGCNQAIFESGAHGALCLLGGRIMSRAPAGNRHCPPPGCVDQCYNKLGWSGGAATTSAITAQAVEAEGEKAEAELRDFIRTSPILQPFRDIYGACVASDDEEDEDEGDLGQPENESQEKPCIVWQMGVCEIPNPNFPECKAGTSHGGACDDLPTSQSSVIVYASSLRDRVQSCRDGHLTAAVTTWNMFKGWLERMTQDFFRRLTNRGMNHFQDMVMNYGGPGSEELQIIRKLVNKLEFRIPPGGFKCNIEWGRGRYYILDARISIDLTFEGAIGGAVDGSFTQDFDPDNGALDIKGMGERNDFMAIQQVSKFKLGGLELNGYLNAGAMLSFRGDVHIDMHVDHARQGFLGSAEDACIVPVVQQNVETSFVMSKPVSDSPCAPPLVRTLGTLLTTLCPPCSLNAPCSLPDYCPFVARQTFTLTGKHKAREYYIEDHHGSAQQYAGRGFFNNRRGRASYLYGDNGPPVAIASILEAATYNTEGIMRQLFAPPADANAGGGTVPQAINDAIADSKDAFVEIITSNIGSVCRDRVMHAADGYLTFRDEHQDEPENESQESPCIVWDMGQCVYPNPNFPECKAGMSRGGACDDLPTSQSSVVSLSRRPTEANVQKQMQMFSNFGGPMAPMSGLFTDSSFGAFFGIDDDDNVIDKIGKVVVTTVDVLGERFENSAVGRAASKVGGFFKKTWEAARTLLCMGIPADNVIQGETSWLEDRRENTYGISGTNCKCNRVADPALCNCAFRDDSEESCTGQAWCDWEAPCDEFIMRIPDFANDLIKDMTKQVQDEVNIQLNGNDQEHKGLLACMKDQLTTGQDLDAALPQVAKVLDAFDKISFDITGLNLDRNMAVTLNKGWENEVQMKLTVSFEGMIGMDQNKLEGSVSAQVGPLINGKCLNLAAFTGDNSTDETCLDNLYAKLPAEAKDVVNSIERHWLGPRVAQIPNKLEASASYSAKMGLSFGGAVVLNIKADVDGAAYSATQGRTIPRCFNVEVDDMELNVDFKIDEFEIEAELKTGIKAIDDELDTAISFAKAQLEGLVDNESPLVKGVNSALNEGVGAMMSSISNSEGVRMYQDTSSHAAFFGHRADGARFEICLPESMYPLNLGDWVG